MINGLLIISKDLLNRRFRDLDLQDSFPFGYIPLNFQNAFMNAEIVIVLDDKWFKVVKNRWGTEYMLTADVKYLWEYLLAMESYLIAVKNIK